MAIQPAHRETERGGVKDRNGDTGPGRGLADKQDGTTEEYGIGMKLDTCEVEAQEEVEIEELREVGRKTTEEEQ